LGSLPKSQTFSPDWRELGLLRVDRVQTKRKRDFQEPRVILHSCFYVQLLIIKLVFILN